MRKVIDGGGDPIERRNLEQRAVALAATAFTFEKAPRKVHEELKPSWRNAKHADDGIRSLEAYAFPLLGGKKLDAITPTDCADVLRPIWRKSRDREPYPPAHARRHAMGLGTREG